MIFRADVEKSELREQISRVWRLSVPAILTQITTIAMQYIDSAMVGDLGENASAAIGLVSTTTWLIGGLGSAIVSGFSVQVAQYIGGGTPKDARRVVKHGLLGTVFVSFLLTVIGILISSPLPRWLGGEEILWPDSSAYFLVYACTLPFMEMNRLSSSFLHCSGNMIVPSILNAGMCVLDVVFNAFLIPRYHVLGAALGTGLAVVVVSIINVCYCCLCYEPLRINRKEPCPIDLSILKRALKIGLPIGAEQAAISGAMVVSTTIIAPLGSVSIAANSFAITAESLCYMPGFGIATAATTLVGQSIGAKDYRLARRYANITVAFGALFMALTGMIMYVGCPLVFKLLTPVASVRALAAQVLRIGLLAEPLYGVSMVASGALRGAEDTLIPSILNLFSIWVVRIGLALLLVDSMGLKGAWIAMAVELCVRGLLMLTRQIFSKYLRVDRKA